MFSREYAADGFGRGVRVFRVAHRGLLADVREPRAVSDGQILNALVAVVNEPFADWTGVQRLLQSLRHDVRLHGSAHAPAHDGAPCARAVIASELFLLRRVSWPEMQSDARRAAEALRDRPPCASRGDTRNGYAIVSRLQSKDVGATVVVSATHARTDWSCGAAVPLPGLMIITRRDS